MDGGMNSHPHQSSSNNETVVHMCSTHDMFKYLQNTLCLFEDDDNLKQVFVHIFDHFDANDNISWHFKD